MTNKVKSGRINFVLVGFGIPIFISLFMFAVRPKPILWLFADPSKLMTTSGAIISSSMDYRSGRSGGWHFVIVYEYKVDGVKYISDQVNYAYTGSRDIAFAESYIAKYPVGKSVLVYYDPSQPKESILEPEVKAYDNFYFWIGGLLFGLFFSLLGF